MAGFEHYAWLMKSEPSEVSVDDVLGMKDCKVGWFGVRNYRWVQVDVHILHKVKLVSIAELRTIPGCEGMRVLQKGNRLSITPVNEDEWKALQPHLISQT